MAYIVDIDDDGDVGKFIAWGPALLGVFQEFSGSRITNVATGTASAPKRLFFPAPTSTTPNGGLATLYIGNTRSAGFPVAGDIFRSGPLSSLPPSSATLTVSTFPPSLVTVSRTELATEATRLAPLAFGAPTWLQVLMGILSLGSVIPVSGQITSVALDSMTPTTLATPGSVTITATGHFMVLIAFTLNAVFFTTSIVVTPAPSGDVTNPSRILRVPCSATSFAVAIASHSLGFQMLRFIFEPIMRAAVGGLVAPDVEARINGVIASKVRDNLESRFQKKLTPTSVISMDGLRVRGGAAGGIDLQLVLADLFGPSVEPIAPPDEPMPG